MLFEPLTLRCGLVVPNRIALAAMTNCQSQPDGHLGHDEFHWLARRADGGFGMIATCAAYVSQDGKAWAGELGVDRDDELPGLTRLAGRIRHAGAVAIAQLFHGGLRAEPSVSGVPVVGPETADVPRVIEAFAAAAERCERAGFDGVELHGAHGYILCQFLSRTQNPRPFEQRAQVVRDVMRAVRVRVSPRFCVGVRLSLEDRGNAQGLDLDESLQVARWLADDGADFIHASLWNATKPTHKRPDEHPIPLVRAAVPAEVAVIAAGAMWTHADAEAALALGADMVAIGRSAIVNPDWPRSDGVVRTPVTRAQLAAAAVSPVFQDYLTRWRDFVRE